jgi:mannose-6-phosphate isomerase-like protein (cupin superfamily)
MQRRDFLTAASLLTGFAAVPQIAVGAALSVPTIQDPLQPVLLPALPPLDHKGGMDIRVWVRSAMTNGLYSCVECAVAPKKMGPPPHSHKALDELMFVLEGTASVLVGNEEVTIQAGGWHLRPRGIVHTFWNASEQPLRFIDMYFNQPFEVFLEQIFHELTPEKGYPDGSEAKNKAMQQLNEEFGLVYLPTAFAERQVIAKKYGLD